MPITPNDIPKFGEQRIIKCNWCGAMVNAIWSRYEPGIKGGFWDISACPCGDMLVFYGKRIIKKLRKGKFY